MKAVFFGTSEFALPALAKLVEDERIELMCVVTRPDRPSGRGQRLTAAPVKQAAKSLGLTIYQPEKVKDIAGELRDAGADVFVLAAYGKLIPEDILKIPKAGPLNIHPSLLPKFRGPSPIESAILEGVNDTGVTIMEMAALMDAGPIVAQSIVELTGKETGTGLAKDLAEIGAGMLISVIGGYVSGEITPIPQHDEDASFTKLITQEDRKLDLAEELGLNERKIRAFADYPGAWLIKDGKRLKVFAADITNGKLVATSIQWEGKIRQQVRLEL